MRIGIYTREQIPKSPTIEWLIKNHFDAFETYSENVTTEFDDLSDREELNMLLFDGEHGHINAVYVENLSVFSAVTLKVLQALIQIQKLDLPVYYSGGCILPSDLSIKDFQMQIQNHWEKITEDTKNIDFSRFDSKNEF